MSIMYPVICHYEDDGYWCEFPDVQGCFSQGNSTSEIVNNAKEALECHLEYYLENNDVLPKATDLSEIKTSGKDFATYIEIDLSKTDKAMRKNVTVPSWLGKKAESLSINFSQTLQEALLQKLGY